jgi:hypothetical protein
MVTNKHKTPERFLLFNLRRDLLSEIDHGVVVKRAGGLRAFPNGTWRGTNEALEFA